MLRDLIYILSTLLPLLEHPKIAPPEFERIWMSAAVGYSLDLNFEMQLNFPSMVVKDVLATVPTANTIKEIEAALVKNGIALMASSPPQNNMIKFYFYGQEVLLSRLVGY